MSELRLGEPHPAAYSAKAYIAKLPAKDLLMWRESLASCALSGNRLAEICLETLRRLMSGQPVSDRYVLGLAWQMRFEEKPKSKPKQKENKRK